MNDSQLKETLKNKMENGEFTVADIPTFFQVFSYLGNEIEDLQEEVEDWNCVIEFEMAGLGTYWLAIKDVQFSTGEGPHADTRLRLILTADDAAKVFSGERDAEAAFTSGELKIEGDLPDAFKLHELIELVLEEIEY